MALNLLKLCVGCDSVEDLEEWIAFRLDERRRAGEPAEHWHTPRMMPPRGDEVTDGGSHRLAAAPCLPGLALPEAGGRPGRPRQGQGGIGRDAAETQARAGRPRPALG